jgi:hypothetical protein
MEKDPVNQFPLPHSFISFLSPTPSAPVAEKESN